MISLCSGQSTLHPSFLPFTPPVTLPSYSHILPPALPNLCSSLSFVLPSPPHAYIVHTPGVLVLLIRLPRSLPSSLVSPHDCLPFLPTMCSSSHSTLLFTIVSYSLKFFPFHFVVYLLFSSFPSSSLSLIFVCCSLLSKPFPLLLHFHSYFILYLFHFHSYFPVPSSLVCAPPSHSFLHP